MTKKAGSDQCPRCDDMQRRLDSELDFLETILKVFRDTDFPDMANVHKLASDALRGVKRDRASNDWRTRKGGPRVSDPGWLLFDIAEAVRDMALTPEQITQEYMARLLYLEVSTFKRKLAKYCAVEQSSWESLKRFIRAASQPGYGRRAATEFHKYVVAHKEEWES